MGNKKKKGDKGSDQGKDPPTSQPKPAEQAQQQPQQKQDKKGKPQQGTDQNPKPDQQPSTSQSIQAASQQPEVEMKRKEAPGDNQPRKDAGKMNNGDWMCPQCNNHNFAKRAKCNKCQTQKPSEGGAQNVQPQKQYDARPSTSQEQPSQGPSKNQPKKEGGKLNKGDWMCPQCNNHNFAKKAKCNKCQTPKPVDPTVQEVQQVVQPTQPQQFFQPQQNVPQRFQQPSQRPQIQPFSRQPFSAPQQVQQQPQRFSAPQQVQQQPQQFSAPQQPQRFQAPQHVPQQAATTSRSQQPQLAEGMQSMRVSKQSKHSSQYQIESSATPSEYEGSKGRKCKLEVNYGKISLNEKVLKECFHYDVSFDPETPKKFLPYALDVFMQQFFQGKIFGSDNRKNIYTAERLVSDGNVIDEFQQEVTAVMGDRTKNFKVKIKFVNVKDLRILTNYNNPIYQNEDRPMDAVQAMDVILRKPFKFIPGTIQVGRGLYFAPRNQMSLGDGMELWYGLFQSAIMGRGGIYLNVDVLHKAFPSAMPLLEFIRVNMARDNRVPSKLENWQEKTLGEHLKMLTIAYRFNNEVKTYGFNGLISPDKATFKDETGRVQSVAQYYQQKKGVRLNFPNLPYLWVGSRLKNIYLPLEFCEIPAGQATNKKCSPKATAEIIRYSATSTDERKRKIRGLLDQINYQNDPTITGFGINVDTRFQNIDGRVIDPPKLKYANGFATPSRGVWNGKLYMEPEQGEIKWCIVNCDERTTNQNLMNFKKDFMKLAGEQRLILKDMMAQEIKLVKVDFNFQRNIEAVLSDCLKAGYRLVVVIVVDRNDCYGRVKQAAELKVGILTQCIKSNTIFKMGRGDPRMTINNILLKVNAKLNGKNHEIEEMSYKSFNQKTSGVMFVGADVTHPSPDQRSIPSVVGVASSHDDVGFKYCCAWRLQDPKKEMIEDLCDILIEHLKFYGAKNRMLPGKILYYRDGVSDGQFKEVLAIEMSAIKRAIQTVYGKSPHAAVTFIVVQKRHHTRFFPTQKEFSEGKFNNITPGTVVDKDIIHPFQYQFFMASHAAIQGVTKPTKYCILINESKIRPDDLQAITYDLCHLFTRCNRSVSYPAPTYYAHLVAARGKNYFAGDRVNLNNLQRENQMRIIRPSIVNNAPMFFV